MNLFDTVVQLLKFFTPHSGPVGAVRKGDRTESMWKACTKKQASQFSTEVEISFLFCTNIISISSKLLFGGLNFLFKTPPKTET